MATAALRLPLLLAVVATMAGPALGDCPAPYQGHISSLNMRVVPGEVRQFPGGWELPAGERALIEGVVNVTGGVTVRGNLFLSSESPSSLLADWIVVEADGTLQAGSQACPLPANVTATIMLRNGAVHPQAGRKALAVMAGGALELHGSKGLDTPWTRLAATAAAGATMLQLSTQAIASWAPGDELAIASTDFDPYQTERVEVVSVSGSQVQVQPPLRFMHFGQVTEGVDERAEVALLSRSIRIVGANDLPGIGCHTIVFENFAAYHVEGVEFANCGQADAVGRYPVHFHMAARVPAGTYLRASAVHDSNFRAITIHGTQGVLLEGNVAVDVAGHAFFLEDGAEWDNVLRGNLGLLVRAKTQGARLGSDRVGANGDLSVFWITNPDNTFEGNVAAATEGWGFFVHTRLAPRGLSQARWPGLRPHETPLQRFANNSAHSCRMCLEMESDFVDDGDVPAVVPNSPQANWNPRNPDRSFAETLVVNFTCHHSFSAGLWVRLGGLIMVDTAWADNAEALQLATTGTHVSTPGTSFMQNLLLVGVSGNRGDPNGSPQFQRWDAALDRSAVRVQDMSSIMTGFKLYDGPLEIDGLIARSWPPGTSPLAVRSHNIFQMAAGTTVRGFKAERCSYRFVVQDSVGDGGVTTSLHDLDGSLSGYADATLLPHSPATSLGFYSAPGCTAHPAYGLACPQHHINLEVGAWDWAAGSPSPRVVVTRANLSPGRTGAAGLAEQRLAGLQGVELSPKSGRGGRYYNVKAAVTGSYLLSWGGITGTGAPTRAFVQCSSCQPGDEVEAVLCLPPGTPLAAGGVTRGSLEFLRSNQDAAAEGAPAYGSLAQMRAASGTGSRYYHDVAAGLLFLRVQQAAGWGGAPATGYCPPGGCSLLVVHASAAAAAPTPAQCESRLAAITGGAPSNADTDPYLAARLPPPLFDLTATCPNLPVFGCDCWGWVGCANRACSTAERTPCDTGSEGSGGGGGGGTAHAPPPPRRPPPPKPPSPSPPPPQPPQRPPPSSPPSPAATPPTSLTCADLPKSGDCCASHCFAQANPNIQAGASFLGFNPSCYNGGLGCQGISDGCRFCRLADSTTQLHLPVCPACICQHYGLPASRCDALGKLASATPSPSPKPPSSPRPPPPHPPPPPPPRPLPLPSPPPPAAVSIKTLSCFNLPASGDCCASHCFSKANPNIQAGASFLGFNPSCYNGGLGCQGSHDGCRFCRLADSTTQLHLPVCPACVCQHYNLPGSRCDALGKVAAATPVPSPRTPRPSPPPLKRRPPRSRTARPPPPQQRPPRPPPPSPKPPPRPPPPRPPTPPPAVQWGQPILVEEFLGSSLNRSLFDVEVDCWGGGNAEKQCYVDRPENLRVAGGRLIIEARRGEYKGSVENCTNNFQGSCDWTQPFTSARIRTKLSPFGSWKYGRIEVRAQMPRGDFLWPAIWMLPTDNVFGTWAASGEIDILEYRGQASFKDVIEGTLHFGGMWPHNAWRGSGRKTVAGVDFAAGMHTFALEWTSDLATGRPKLMRWLVDGTQFHEQRLDISWKINDAAPYTRIGQPWDQRFHLVLNLAVGGNFFSPTEFGGFYSQAEWDAAIATWTRPRLEIDSVKVWAWPPST